MFGIKREFESIRRNLDNLWNNIDTFEEARRSLFTKDRHGMMRPKVDLLYESFDKTATDIFIDINRLNKRMDKLEKYENPKNKKG